MHLILVVILIVLAGLVLWSLLNPSTSSTSSRSQGDYEAMVRCQHCGVNLPQSQATRDSDGNWRCPAHRHEHD